MLRNCILWSNCYKPCRKQRDTCIYVRQVLGKQSTQIRYIADKVFDHMSLGDWRSEEATRVDGVYSADPLKDRSAVKFESLSYDEVLEKQLGVMDLTAICLARDHKMPLRVFAMQDSGALRNAVILGEGGTLVS